MKVNSAYFSVFVYVAFVALVMILLSFIFNRFNFIRETESEIYVWDNIKGQFVLGGLVCAALTPLWAFLFIPSQFKINIIVLPVATES